MVLTLELHQVRYFVALAGSLNFTRAAEQCNVTQSALTKAIQKLERELGGELVFRERQLTQLTDLGRIVRPTLEATLAALDSTRLHAKEFQQKTIAPFKMALTPCVSASLAAAPLSEMAAFMPGLQIEMVEADSSLVVGMLLDGEANAALTGGDVDSLPNRIDVWHLFREEFVILAARSHPFAAMPSVPLDALGDVAWLDLVGCEPVGRFWQARALQGSQVRIAHRSRDMGHLQHMAEASLGVVLAPKHLPRLPSLTARSIVDKPLQRDVSLLVVSGRRYSPALDAFVKIARTRDWRGVCEARSGPPVSETDGEDPPPPAMAAPAEPA